MSRPELALLGGPPAVVQNNHGRAWPFWSDQATERVAGLVARGRAYAPGSDPEIGTFEEAFANRLGGMPYALMTNSGTSALHSAYFGLGLPPGSQVLVPTNTFLATVTPLLLLGLEPVLYGADPVDGAIDIDDAAARVTERTAALVVTHLWGQPADVDAVVALARRAGLALVEDVSHAHGTRYAGRALGSIGDVAAFSLSSRKTVSGGTAGILVTRDRAVHERALLLGHPAARNRNEIRTPSNRDYLDTGLGANYRATPLAAAMAADHLARLNETIRVKNANLARLAEALEHALPELRAPRLRPGTQDGTWYGWKSQWHGRERTGVSRDLLVRALAAEGVPVEAPGPLLHHRHLFRRPGMLLAGRDTPLVDPDDYGPTDRMQQRLVSWETKHLHEPAGELVDAWIRAVEKVSAGLPQLVSAA